MYKLAEPVAIISDCVEADTNRDIFGSWSCY